MKILQVILLPLSFCYGLLMKVRNLFFDLGILPVKEFDRAVISVGNLSFGGTGKTPQIEYLIRLLTPAFCIATLSRGYGRTSSGFIIASKKSNVKYVGDEPLQFIKKFDNIKVAVDEKRIRGIELLLEKHPETDVILLDDAFQHRYVKPGLSILLTDYHKLYTEDHVLPSGTLREFKTGAGRADLIIVTKTPKIFSPITRRRIIDDIKPLKHQTVLFSFLKYGELVPVFDTLKMEIPGRVTNILLFTGIANDYPLSEHLARTCSEVVPVKFPDHHVYSEKDIARISQTFHNLPTQKKLIVTTEKDVMRLKTPELSTILKNLPLFYVPVEVDFHGTDKQLFDNVILSYVNKNKRNH